MPDRRSGYLTAVNSEYKLHLIRRWRNVFYHQRFVTGTPPNPALLYFPAREEI